MRVDVRFGVLEIVLEALGYGLGFDILPSSLLVLDTSDPTGSGSGHDSEDFQDCILDNA